jgi:hypothetical protein
LIERGKIARGLYSLGLWQRDWTKAHYSKSPSVGNIEGDFFEPGQWKTEYPQPAFGQMDAADAFWAASIASRFTNDMIKAIVDTGELSNPDNARFLTDVIIKRRDKVVAYWIGQTNPLDSFTIARTAAGSELEFDNAAIRVKVANAGATYQASWTAFDNTTGTERAVGEEAHAGNSRITIPDGVWGPADAAGFRYATASIKTIDASHPHWANPVLVTVREKSGDVDIVGIDRPTGR